MMWGYNMTGMGWWMIVSSVFWLGLVAIAVWAFARWVGQQTPGGSSSASGIGAPGPAASEILRQRYARGEIDDETFKQMQRQLETSPVEQRTPATLS